MVRIERMLKSINTDKFDQELISSLLIAIREKLPKNSLSREIADFIAHPRLKEKGHLYENVKKVHASLLESYNSKTNEVNSKITIDNPFHINESIIEIDATLLSINSNLILQKTEKRISELQTCIVMLLQRSHIQITGLEGVKSIELIIAVNKAGYLCLMAALPLPVKNPILTIQPQYPLEIKYEIMTSLAPFTPQKIDPQGFGYFEGILNARRDEMNKIVYSLIN